MIPLALLAVFAVEVERAGVESDAGLFASQILQESTWRHDVCSPLDACGLTQFTPPTQGDIFPATEPSCEGMPASHAPCAIRAQILYIKRLLRANRSADTKRDQWALAFSGYNGGQGWVNRETAKCGQRAGCDPGRWRGHVQNVCLRADWACEENKAYPGKIEVHLERGGVRAGASFGRDGWRAGFTIGG